MADDLDAQILANSGVFDAGWYVSQAGDDAKADPAAHYLRVGWKAGLEPNASFAGDFMYPYYASAGFGGPPAITWITLNAAKADQPPTQQEIDAMALEIRAGGLFDEARYAESAGLTGTALDPATHYVLVGEAVGQSPAAGFDARYYAERYPDAIKARNLLVHYLRHGKPEGRRIAAVRGTSAHNAQRFDPAKENILFAVHDASRSGAPILGLNIATRLAEKYNVFMVCFGPGELQAAFEAVSAEVHYHFNPGNPVDIEHALAELLDARHYRYAIVNGVESHWLIPPCMRRFIATELLVHEFVLHYEVQTLEEVLAIASEVVVETELVAANARALHPALNLREIRILPQGISQLPASRTIKPLSRVVGDLQRLREERDTVVVLGAGVVDYRKGVDLFLAAAAEVLRRDLDRPVRFLWIGDGFRPKEDLGYPMYLREQIARSGLEGHADIIDAVQDLDPVYRIADIFFLASRLDPLPNVTIDAAVRGIPIVCFRNASGTAEILASNPQTADGVVDYMDVTAAAAAIVRLINDRAYRARTADATLSIGVATFDMTSYVSKIDAFARDAAVRVDQQRRDAAVLRAESEFDEEAFERVAAGPERRGATVARYLAIAGGRSIREPRPGLMAVVPRPAAGFNPIVYARAFPLERPDVDPFADYVRRGKPEGPWQASVLQPGAVRVDPDATTRLRTLLHIHCDRPQTVTDVLARLAGNRLVPDLIVTANSDGELSALRRLLLPYRHLRIALKVLPAAMPAGARAVVGLASEIVAYQLVASVRGGDDASRALEHLVGGQCAMADEIASAFARQPSLGLVFPGDAYTIGADGDEQALTSAARRLGFAGSPYDVADFPNDAMFWMRGEALEPLVWALSAGAEDDALPWYGARAPAGLERLLPLSAHFAGYTYAMTHVPGLMRPVAARIRRTATA